MTLNQTTSRRSIRYTKAFQKQCLDNIKLKRSLAGLEPLTHRSLVVIVKVEIRFWLSHPFLRNNCPIIFHSHDHSPACLLLYDKFVVGNASSNVFARLKNTKQHWCQSVLVTKKPLSVKPFRHLYLKFRSLATYGLSKF